MSSISNRERPPETETAAAVASGESARQLVAPGHRLIGTLLRKDVSGDGAQTTFSLFRALLPRVPWLWVSFLIAVIIPSIVAIFYLAIVATSQFSVEARFVVRAADPATSAADKLGALASLGTPFSYSPSAQNAYVVAHYIRSRTAVNDMLEIVDLRSIYRRPEADFWARLKVNASEEELVEYWHQMVRAYVDTSSNIVILEVRAFRPEDALKIAEAILTLSERLVNQMSQRARQDVMRFSEEEVRRADVLIRSALDNLQKARDSEGMLDPAKAADETGQLLMQLMADKIRLESELHFALSALDKNAPTVRQLNSRLEIIGGQITALRSSLAGDTGVSRNVASALRKFEQLEVQRFLADKVLTLAEDGLERARIRAERQNLYFMVFVPPSLPTKAILPRRLAYSIFLPVVFLMLWGIAALLWASLEDHRN